MYFFPQDLGEGPQLIDLNSDFSSHYNKVLLLLFLVIPVLTSSSPLIVAQSLANS